MRSSIGSCVVHFLTYFILISLSDEVPLSGKNVRDAKPGELPFVVSIQNLYGGHFCVGTLISQKSVLTVAHCIVEKNIDKVLMLVGSNDLRKGKIYRPESWISYEKWTNQTNELYSSLHDIAIITLKEKVEEVQAAAILTFDPQDLQCQKVRIAGWGFSAGNEIQPLILRTAVVKVMSNKACAAHVESLLRLSFFIPQTYFCSRADPWVLGDCGDSGAPILNKLNQVVGIHTGVCPKGIKNHNYPREFVDQNLVNLHLHLDYYRRFIINVRQD